MGVKIAIFILSEKQDFNKRLSGLPVTGAAANADGIAGFDFDVMTQKPFRRNDIVDVEKENEISKVISIDDSL